MTSEQEVVNFGKANPKMSLNQMAHELKSSRPRITKILIKHGLRKPSEASVEKYTTNEFWLPIKNELDKTVDTINDIAARHSTTVTTIKKAIKLNKYPYKKRKEHVYAQLTKIGGAKENWGKIKVVLDSTNLKLVDIAKQFGVSYRTLRYVISENGYNMSERRIRVRAPGPEFGGIKLIHPIEPKETMSGDMRSIIAHRLPLNRIAEVYQ